MTSWRRALEVYRDRRMLAILGMGFSSGLPLPLTFGTLSYWLAEAGVSRTDIGLFVLVGFSYNYKFAWSPFIDRLPIPYLTRRLGRRRSWAVVIQLLLMAAIFALGRADPRTELAATALLAVLVAFLSASQDIVIDAYRIELLQADEQGAGAAATQWGYRIGMLAASAGAFDAAAFGGWRFSYTVMAALMAVGLATVLLTREPDVAPPPRVARSAGLLERLAAWSRQAIVMPFGDFMARRGWIAILAFIVLYKCGEALAGTMANPLYQELGFTKLEVGNIGKIVSFAASLSGVALGGVLVARLGLFAALLFGGVLQMLSNLLYIALLLAGHSDAMLALSIFGENFTGGLASAAFVAYLSGLCSLAFTATQYALFSSIAAVPVRFLAAPAGWLVDRLDWIPFFLVATAACLPSLVLLLYIMRRRDGAAVPAQ
ncbi:MAG TPA: MFS transporter [Stellaceae bacterium]|jgi:PAT family beta-lactamase induction signal transducer AmpG|nr:MFS transporter [Stellaceae bacterium]